MELESQILQSITAVLDSKYTQYCNIKLNTGATYSSITVTSPGTVYRAFKGTGELLFARINTSPKKPFIGFYARFSYLFSDLGVDFYKKKSDPDFIRIKLNTFIDFLNNNPSFASVMQRIFISLFNVETFGCCHSYVKCSDAGECIHPDPIYALGCYYSKNLSEGRIFYGVNRNS